MNDLKPCPFCGGEAEIIICGITNMIPQVRCTKCLAYMGKEDISFSFVRGDLYFKTKEEAIEAWNRRATDADKGVNND